MSLCYLNIAMTALALLHIQETLGLNFGLLTHFVAGYGLLVCDAVYSGK
jgi:hypothetical protein